LAASGTFAYGIELAEVVELGQLGGIITKGLSREPMDGNPAPRLFETESGMMNSVGLQNIGVRAFVSEKLPALRAIRTPVFANVFGYAVEDYVEVLRVLEDAEGVAGYELNVSCPNTKHGGMVFASDPGLLGEVVAAARSAISAGNGRPLVVKLSPNVARIQEMALAAVEAGADALSLVNTFVALAIDARTRRPRLGNGFGGLSGPAIKPIALRMVYETAQAVKVPIIGLGGIATGVDAAEYVIAGATAVEVGTANFWDPQAPLRIARELDEFLKEENVANAAELRGTLRFKDNL
jgi:dihydroorotate dehydrogenase (NAD+) catalytic subunit